MTATRQSQSTQESSTQKSDTEIMIDVVKSGGRHVTGIGPRLHKSVIEHSAASSSSSQRPSQSPSIEEFEAMKAKVAMMEHNYEQFMRYIATQNPEMLPSFMSAPPPPAPPVNLSSATNDEDEEEEDDDDS